MLENVLTPELKFITFYRPIGPIERKEKDQF